MTTDIRERVAEVLVRGHNNWMLSGGFPVDRESFQVSALLEAFPQLAEEVEYEYIVQVAIPGREDLEKLTDHFERTGSYKLKNVCGGTLHRRRRAGDWEEVE